MTVVSRLPERLEALAYVMLLVMQCVLCDSCTTIDLYVHMPQASL